MENISRVSVLYVGQDSNDRRSAKVLLNESNINVLFVESFRETIFSAAAQNFDAFLVDGSFANKDTMHFCRALRRSHPEIPIICFACFAPVSEIESVISSGATTYLIRPYPGNLATAVTDAVQTAAT